MADTYTDAEKKAFATEYRAGHPDLPAGALIDVDDMPDENGNPVIRVLISSEVPNFEKHGPQDA